MEEHFLNNESFLAPKYWHWNFENCLFLAPKYWHWNFKNCLFNPRFSFRQINNGYLNKDWQCVHNTDKWFEVYMSMPKSRDLFEWFYCFYVLQTQESNTCWQVLRKYWLNWQQTHSQMWAIIHPNILTLSMCSQLYQKLEFFCYNCSYYHIHL